MPRTFDFNLKEQLSTGQLVFPHLPVCAYAKKTNPTNQKTAQNEMKKKGGGVELTHEYFLKKPLDSD